MVMSCWIRCAPAWNPGDVGGLGGVPKFRNAKVVAVYASPPWRDHVPWSGPRCPGANPGFMVVPVTVPDGPKVSIDQNGGSGVPPVQDVRSCTCTHQEP